MPPVNRSRTVVWRPLIVCPQPDVYRRLHAVLTELAVEQPCTLTEYPRSGAIAAMAERNACNVCFLDAATDCEHAQMLISELAPSVPVVALHPRNDADLILRCLRRGASEFVADPTMDAVGGVFERLARTRSDAVYRAPGLLYCVIPGKPGCGGSTLAANLAIQLRRDGANPVLLVDGDQLTASIAFMLKLKPEFHLEDVQRDWARMDDDLWARLTVPAFGVDVLAAPDDPTRRTEVSRQFAAELCAFWRERYEIVVLDLPDVRTGADCGFTAQADLIMLVTTNELAALQATRRSLRYLDAGAGRPRQTTSHIEPSHPCLRLQARGSQHSPGHATLRHPRQRLRRDSGGAARRQTCASGVAIRGERSGPVPSVVSQERPRQEETDPGWVCYSNENRS